MVSIGVIFAGTVVVGVLATNFAFNVKKYSIHLNQSFLRLYGWAILLVALGFIVHTSGDFLGEVYASEDIEHILESIAHIILLAAFTLFVVAANKMMESTKQVWFE